MHNFISTSAIWFIAVSFCHNATAQTIDTIFVEEQFQYTDISSHLEFFVDNTKSLQLEDIISSKQTWLKNTAAKLSFGPKQAQHWIHFICKNKSATSAESILNLEYAHLAKFKIHQLRNGDIKSEKIQGDNFDFKERLVNHPHFIYHFELEPEEIVEFFISFDQEGQDLPIPISISSQKYFYENDHNVRLLHGLGFGLASIIILGLIGLFIITRIRFFLLQVVASIFSLFYVIAEEGYGFMYMWGHSPEMNGISRPLFLGIVTIFSLLFTCEFLGYNKNKNLYRIIKSAIIIYAVYMLLAHPIFVLPLNSHRLIGTVIFLFLLVTLIFNLINIGLCFYKAIWENSTDARVLLLIFGLISIAIASRAIAFQGGFNNILTKHTGILTLSFQISLIGLYLFYKSIQIWKENQNIKLAFAEERQIASEAIVDSLHHERERISMDIHDSLASLLSATRINLEALKHKYDSLTNQEEYKTASSLLVKIGAEMRNISHNLMPKTLKAFGIIAELEKHIIDIHTESSIQIDFEHIGFKNRLPERIELELYYISMEILDNILKYSNAKHALIQFNQFEDELIAIFEDNGIGFSVDDIRKGANGLNNIQNRITWLNGQIDINAIKNEGMTITINIPLN